MKDTQLQISLPGVPKAKQGRAVAPRWAWTEAVPPVENRVVEMALRNALEPIFEHTFAEHSYGFRPGRGA
ncbi:MAG TPA: hypothetical protein P5186_29670, partial [Candidatus Paceibacterota bacterium]|nr:hypothetical protein [Candidatus Paceibacterota bacterium]